MYTLRYISKEDISLMYIIGLFVMPWCSFVSPVLLLIIVKWNDWMRTIDVATKSWWNKSKTTSSSRSISSWGVCFELLYHITLNIRAIMTIKQQRRTGGVAGVEERHWFGCGYSNMVDQKWWPFQSGHSKYAKSKKKKVFHLQ